MSRTVALMLALTVVSFAVGCAGEQVRALRTPEVRPAPGAFEMDRGAEGGNTPERSSDEEELKIGDFQTPERVPDYEILEKRVDERDGARAVRLLIDTRSREEEEFLLITRDLKSRYSGYDAASVEFTDTEDVLFYNGDPATKDLLAYYGGALIFNTYEGVDYLGYIYGPPNMEGYYVKAAN
ncbi:MAG: hypothetical protein M3151_11420 [Actinomycetota bacterium]|nr:hypothetical protein [Actinomycetota bacterium]